MRNFFFSRNTLFTNAHGTYTVHESWHLKLNSIVLLLVKILKKAQTLSFQLMAKYVRQRKDDSSRQDRRINNINNTFDDDNNVEKCLKDVGCVIKLNLKNIDWKMCNEKYYICKKNVYTNALKILNKMQYKKKLRIRIYIIICKYSIRLHAEMQIMCKETSL